MEQRIYADSLVAAFENGTLSVAAFLDAVPALAASPVREVASAPIGTIEWIRLHVYATGAQRAELARTVAAAYRPRLDALGLDRRDGDSPEDILLRRELLRLFALTIEDAGVREAMAKRGRAVVDAGGAGTLAPDAVDPDARMLALQMAATLGGEREFELFQRHARAAADPMLRQQLRYALGGFEQPALAERASRDSLDRRWDSAEALDPVYTQLSRDTTGGAARRWLRDNMEAVDARVPRAQRSYLPQLDAMGLCSEADADALHAFYANKMADVDGGVRSLAQAVEATRLCAALRAHHRQ
jgi:alanyl aminopeptidase